MSIGGLRVEILIQDSFSLKEKRKILNSLKQRIFNNFNASVAEIDDSELWNKSTLEIAIAAKDQYNLNDKISKIKNFLMKENGIEVLKIEVL
ncbi:MAG: DUF503 domain-containing protein [Candidatus Hydrothermales bacterium]